MFQVLLMIIRHRQPHHLRIWDSAIWESRTVSQSCHCFPTKGNNLVSALKVSQDGQGMMIKVSKNDESLLITDRQRMWNQSAGHCSSSININ